MTDLNRNLKAKVDQSRTLIVPGVFDSISARLTERAGFQAALVSSMGAEGTLLASRNFGLLSMSERARHLRYIHEAVKIPLFVDIESGYGNALNTFYTAQEFERSGASMLILNDQTVPSVSPFSSHLSLIEAEEMVGKIRAAKDALENPATLVAARTDCFSEKGLDEVFRRINKYRAAGADLLVVGGLTERNAISAIAERSKKLPLGIEQVESNVTGDLAPNDLSKLGFQMIFYPASTLFAAVEAEQEALMKIQEGLTLQNSPDQETLKLAFDNEFTNEGEVMK